MITKQTFKDNEENLFRWASFRRSGFVMSGKIRCTFSRIYLPMGGGRTSLLWSLQKKMFPEIVIEDVGINELNADVMQYIFGVMPPINSENFYDASTLHVGKLSDASWQLIKNSKNGMPTTPYVLYYPDRFTWECDTTRKVERLVVPVIPTPNPEPQPAKSKLVIPALLAAASFIID